MLNLSRNMRDKDNTGNRNLTEEKNLALRGGGKYDKANPEVTSKAPADSP